MIPFASVLIVMRNVYGFQELSSGFHSEGPLNVHSEDTGPSTPIVSCSIGLHTFGCIKTLTSFCVLSILNIKLLSS